MSEKEQVYSTIFRSKKMAILTGAGISCNAGIPDFRSSNGLYNFAGKNNIKGKDLFDISLFHSEETIGVFAKFMSNLYSQSVGATPTKTHQFISDKINDNKVVRCYTQNIDGIESKLGLNLKFEQEDSDVKATNLQIWKSLEVVQLHGDLNKLSCTNCSKTSDWNDKFIAHLSNGELPLCPSCVQNREERSAKGKRCSTSIGSLRPNIVLYGENHPYSELITVGLNSDMKLKTDLLLIFGTSLKVHGVKALVKSLSKQIHSRGGSVILVNKVELNGWNDIIDHQVLSDCDDFVSDYQTYEALMKSYKTPPSTPRKCRIRDVLNTPSQPSTPRKRLTPSTPTSVKRKISALTPKQPRASIKSLLNPPTPQKKMKFDIHEDPILITPDNSPSTPSKNRKMLRSNNMNRRTPSIHRIKNLID